MPETQKNTESLRQDFQDWLSHPLTDTFFEIVSKLKEQYIAHANDISYNQYYKSERSETATVLYGKADGIQTMLAIITDCKKDKEKVDSLFVQAFGGDKENE